MKVLLIGAGRLGRVLALELLHAGHEIRLLDRRPERLAVLPEQLAGHTVPGSPLERRTLTTALDGCDALAAVTEDDALNAIIAIAARREQHVPLAVAVVGNPTRAEAIVGLGAHVVCPTARAARDVHLALTRSDLETEIALGGEAGVFRVEVPPRLAGRTCGELARSGEIVPVAVERGGRVLLATTELAVGEGDVLHVAAGRRNDLANLVRP